MHEHRAMRVTLDQNVDEDEIEEGSLPLLINGVNFNELEDAPAREREPLARSTTSIKMNGSKKQGYFPLLHNGVLIPVSVSLNNQTKFARLQVGK